MHPYIKFLGENKKNYGLLALIDRNHKYIFTILGYNKKKNEITLKDGSILNYKQNKGLFEFSEPIKFIKYVKILNNDY